VIATWGVHPRARVGPGYAPRVVDSGVRLTDLLMSLSLATDLGFGQPPEHMLRAARISLRLGHRLGLDTGQLATLYDVSILTYVGCPVYGNEAAAFGDDIDFRAHAVEIDLAGFTAMMFMLRRAGAGTPAFNRARQKATFMATGGRHVVELMAGHCAAAGELSDRLGLDAAVRAGVEQSYARWDGRGVPRGLEGDGVALAARISHVAEACEVLHRTGGVEPAVDMVRSRSGTHFDPAIAAAVEPDPDALFDGLDDIDIHEFLELEPIERTPLGEDDLDRALEAIGDFCDMRCPYFAGHARGTAELVEAAVASLHLPVAESTLARRAALVHDVGRFGVPGTVWDKAGPLGAGDHERMRMHVYYVERIFNRPEPLRRIGLLAATHHERMDGSGYHRGVGGTMLSLPARVLAAADAYHAMTQPRPHRDARSPDDAARELRREADAGRLDPVATDAVLAAAGHTASRSRGGGPAGLTARECDVLALIAQGLPTKAIARRLGISPKTVGNHIESIYTKLDVSNRAAAAMRAMQYGLAGSVPTQTERASQ
jgi:HD-GYP domain-containing protein (c-di-GMP phosphodiesterase class II)